MNYTKESLKNIPENKTFEVFKNILSRVQNSEEITYFEADFFSFFLKTLNMKGDEYGTIYDYYVCKDFLFKELHQIYNYNLDGYLEVEKEDKLLYYPDGDIKIQYKKLTIEERQKDAHILNNFIDEWKIFIDSDKNKLPKGNKLKDIIEKLVIVETRKSLKNQEGLPFYKNAGHFLKLNSEKRIYLQSKYAYLMTKDIFEEENLENFKINFNGKELKFTPEFIVHILIRHFFPKNNGYVDDLLAIVKYGKIKTKSMFKNEYFYPRHLFEILRDIFNEIQNAEIILNIPDSIIFRYLNEQKIKNNKENIYQIWIKKNGELESFYLLEDKQGLTEVLGQQEIQINNYLSIFKK